MFRWPLLFILSLLSVVGCNDLNVDTENNRSKEDELIVLSTEFEHDYKRFYVNTKVRPDFHSMLLDNEELIDSVATLEINDNLVKVISKAQPKLIEIRNMKAREIENMNLNILVLADLTLSPQQIEAQREAVEKLRRLFSFDNLYVSFMYDNTTTQPVLATDYVLNNHFTEKPSGKLLYESIAKKTEEIKASNNDGTKKEQETPWDFLSVRQKALIVFSDEQVYHGNIPIDPNHFDIQQKLMEVDQANSYSPVYYISFRDEAEKEQDLSNEAESLLMLICKNTHGNYYNSFDMGELSNDLLKVLNKTQADYQLVFENPDRKVYRGVMKCMRISCFSGDSILASGNAYYSVGSLYDPVVINGYSTLQIILFGCIDVLLFIGFLYLTFQFIIPYVRYLLFKRRYITQYTGSNMSVNGMLVQQSCYYCKAPFAEGDEVIVKCAHTLHHECWDENEYKCPEYGSKCKSGRHFYNRVNLFDSRNASFYFRWLLGGVLAGLVAWISFSIIAHKNIHRAVTSVVLFENGLSLDSPEAASVLENYGTHIYHLPFYGLNLSFFLILFLSVISSHGQWRWRRSGSVALRAVLGGVCGYISFLLGSVITILLGFSGNSLLVDWFPWLLMGLSVTFAVAYGTDIKLKKALVGAAISILFGMGSMYLWAYTNTSATDTRELALLSYLLYSVGLAVTLAVASPKSKRYFLRVVGPIKPMDIAIYKWMGTSVHNRRITIGKSVNCNLQMTWDLTSNIAPEQAELRMEYGELYLLATEEGVVVKKSPLSVGTKLPLFHGNSFTIGRTKFTYIEKDM